jgi:putative flippase GtrA
LTINRAYVTIRPVGLTIRALSVPLGAPGHRALRASFLRFLVVGALNTALTGALIVAISKWIDIQLAYTIVFVVGLIFTTAMAGPFVFRAPLTGRALRRFMSWYLCVYLLGVSVVHVAEHSFHIAHVWIAAAVIAVTAPLNFLGGRRAFLTRAASSSLPGGPPSHIAAEPLSGVTTDRSQGAGDHLARRKASVSASAAGVPISKKRSCA